MSKTLSETTAGRGPKLATKLAGLGLLLLIIPWLGIQSLNTMKDFLIDGQRQAQLLAARGIATLLTDRPELFSDIPRTADGFAELPLFPSPGRITLDGYDEDWRSLQGYTKQFGQADETPQFSLLLSENAEYLYGLIKVVDHTPVTRHPGYLRMDNSDHLRLYLKTANQQDMRILITFEGYGNISAFQMDEQWQFALPGPPEYRVRGYVTLHQGGYDLEFRLPLSLLGHSKQLGIEVADVQSTSDRTVTKTLGTFPRSSSRSGTLPGNTPENFNPVIIRSASAEAFLAGLQEDNARLWILDDQQRVRAVAGSLETALYRERGESLNLWQWLIGYLTTANTDPSRDSNSHRDQNNPTDQQDPSLVLTRNDDIYQQAIAGQPGTASRRTADGRSSIITAAYPIKADNRIIGALLLEKNTADILQLQRQSLEKMALLTLLSLAVVALTIMLFASRLAFRIHRLGKDVSLNIDEYGRLQQLNTIHGGKSGDELGDLARTIEKILLRLNQHQQFLTTIPRTLRHEINNPLNTIGTSLQQLEQTEQTSPHLESARRGLDRIYRIINALSEAVSLESALSSDSMQALNLSDLLTAYIRNQSPQHPVKLLLETPDQPITIKGSGDHLEQLLDKLLDNARDFSPPDGTIRFRLRRQRQRCQLTITNQGATIPPEQLDKLFQLMGSYRSDQHNQDGSGQNARQNFGLGLYIARVIAEHHGGEIAIDNQGDGSGVAVKVTLPLWQD